MIRSDEAPMIARIILPHILRVTVSRKASTASIRMPHPYSLFYTGKHFFNKAVPVLAHASQGFRFFPRIKSETIEFYGQVFNARFFSNPVLN